MRNRPSPGQRRKAAGRRPVGQQLQRHGNNQGTGTTIDQITTAGRRSLFAKISAHGLPGGCPGGVGLTTALTVIPGDYVIVGSLPTTNGKSATAKYGCLIVLNSTGQPVSTISGGQIQGPWDMTSVTRGAVTTLFVSMVLNGGAAKGVHTIDNSTVLRIRPQTSAGSAPKVLNQQVIANEIPWRDDPTALVIGPTGWRPGSNGTLYLADTLDNRIAAIRQALTRSTAAIPQALTRSTAAADGGRRRHDRVRRRSAQAAARPDAGSGRRPPDLQCRRREDRRDDARGQAAAHADRRQQDRRRLAVRPGGHRRAASIASTTATTRSKCSTETRR